MFFFRRVLVLCVLLVGVSFSAGAQQIFASDVDNFPAVEWTATAGGGRTAVFSGVAATGFRLTRTGVAGTIGGSLTTTAAIAHALDTTYKLSVTVRGSNLTTGSFNANFDGDNVVFTPVPPVGGTYAATTFTGLVTSTSGGNGNLQFLFTGNANTGGFFNVSSVVLTKVPELNAAAGMIPFSLLTLALFAAWDRRRACSVAC